MYISKAKVIDDSNVKYSNIIDLRTVDIDEEVMSKFIDLDCLSESVIFKSLIPPTIGEVVTTLNLPENSYELEWDGDITLKLPSAAIFIPYTSMGDDFDILKSYLAFSATGGKEPDTYEGAYTSSYTNYNVALYEWLTKTVYEKSTDNDNMINILESNNFVTKFQEYQLQEFKKALPYVGKKLTLINFPGKLWGVLKYDESQIPDSGYVPEVLEYIATGIGAYPRIQDLESPSIIQVECCLKCFGDVNSKIESFQQGYLIYWKEIYKSTTSFNIHDSSQITLPTIN